MAKYHTIYGKKGAVQETGEDGDTSENEDEDAFAVKKGSIVKNYRCHHWIQVLL